MGKSGHMAFTAPQVGDWITRVHQHGGDVVVEVRGEIDLLTAPRLHETVRAVLERQPPVLVIDLLAVGFLGVPGLATLLDIQHRAGERTRLRVAAGPAIRRSLCFTGLDRRFALYPTVEDAMA
jgi:anti-sigma B factor antagonist